MVRPMRALRLAFVSMLLLGPAACGDDTGTGGTGGGGSTGDAGGPEGGSGGTATEGGGGSGGEPTAGGGGEGGGPAADCDNLPAGPIAATLATDTFSGSEDFAFDGSGGIIGKDGGSIIRVTAGGDETTVAELAQGAYGLRYGESGDLFVALPNQGTLKRVSGGQVLDVVTGLAGPNGVYPDFDGNIWVTEFGGNRVIRVNPDETTDTIASGAGVSQPNGVVLDDARGILFFTNYSQGRVNRVDPEGGTPELVGEVDGAALDGLVLDACGNLYTVDNAGNAVYRLALDEDGALVGEPELIADLPENVANAQFGSGAGWNATSLYVGGSPGSIYEIPIGVPGAPVPTP